MQRVLKTLSLLAFAVLVFAPLTPALGVQAASRLARGAVISLEDTPHLWFADEAGVLHWGGDTRALAGRYINWNLYAVVSLAELQAFEIGDPWLTAGLIKEGDPIYLVKWETDWAEPKLLHIQSWSDAEIFGLSGSNYGNFVYDIPTWEAEYGLAVSGLTRSPLAPATPPVDSTPHSVPGTPLSLEAVLQRLASLTTDDDDDDDDGDATDTATATATATATGSQTATATATATDDGTSLTVTATDDTADYQNVLTATATDTATATGDQTATATATATDDGTSVTVTETDDTPQQPQPRNELTPTATDTATATATNGLTATATATATDDGTSVTVTETDDTPENLVTTTATDTATATATGDQTATATATATDDGTSVTITATDPTDDTLTATDTDVSGSTDSG